MASPEVLPNGTVLYNGMYLPAPFPRYRNNPKEGLEYLKQFPLRASDILICGPMKSGNHWIFEIITMLISGKLEYSKYNVVNSHLDFVDANDIAKREDPRILSTHAAYSLIPEIQETKKYKIVFLLWNPKDRAVSLYNYVMGKAEAYPLNFPWSSFYEEVILEEKEIFGGWFQYIKEWEKHIKSSNIHVVYYEDLKRHFTRTVHKLAEFLRVERDQSFYTDVEDICSFQKMRDNKDDDTVQFNEVGQTSMYRKGEIGDWKHYFTVAQNEQFDEKYRKEMEGLDLTFTYE